MRCASGGSSARARRCRLEPARRAFAVGAWTTGVFLIAAAPLLWQAAQLLVSHEYVTPAYQWRSAPRGVDLLAPLLGPPLTRSIYTPRCT